LQSHKPILDALNDAGHEAYFVGGCVRDYILGRPCKDIDICTSATPDEVATLFPESKLVGAHFGVTIVKLGDLEAEVATFRTDGCYSDSRRPNTVAFTQNVREDLLRRDFTINAILMDAKGNILDPMRGQLDLALGQVRCVGDAQQRFSEDALRMLRAVRFAAQLHFDIASETFSAIISNAHRISLVSEERIQAEFSKILTSGRAAQGVWDLRQSGLLTYFLPEVSGLFYCDQNPVYHPEGNVLVHTLGLLQQLPAGCSLTLALAALLHDIGKPATFALKDGQPTFHGHEEQGALIAEAILRRLKFSTEVIDTVVSLVAQHMTFRVSKEMRKAKLMRFLRQENFAELLELHRMDATAGSGNLSNYQHCVEMLKELPPEVLRPVKLITGQDLIEMGLTPGPEFKRILNEVETLQLEGTVSTRDAALDAAQDLIDLKEAA